MTEWENTDDETVAALANMIVVLADNKYALGKRLAEWAVGPPTLEGSVAGAAIGQQLLGQARVLYPVLDDLPGEELRMLQTPEGRTRRYAMTSVDEPWPSWPHAVCALLLVNTACNVVLFALGASAHEDLAKRVGRMLEDERLQTQYSAGRVRELVYRYSAGWSLLQERVDDSFTEALAWFGPEPEPGSEALAAAGLVRGGAEQWRQQWLDIVAPVFDEVGIAHPARWDGAGRWEWGDVPWDRWNPLQRRLEVPTTATSG